MPLTTWLGLATEPGEAAGLGALDADVCRDLAAALAVDPGSRWCLTLIGPDGRAAAHGCAGSGPGSLSTGNDPVLSCRAPARPDPARPDPARLDLVRPVLIARQGLGFWLAGIRLSTIEAGTCTHPRETSAYRPSPTLRHLINVRDRTCYFPPCRRQAVKWSRTTPCRSSRADGPVNAISGLVAVGTIAPSRLPAGTLIRPSLANSSGPSPAAANSPLSRAATQPEADCPGLRLTALPEADSPGQRLTALKATPTGPLAIYRLTPLARGTPDTLLHAKLLLLKGKLLLL